MYVCVYVCVFVCMSRVDIMSSKLQHIPLPSNKKKPDCEIEQISAGSSVSAAVMSNGGGLYMWGTSGTSNYRTPLPMKVKSTDVFFVCIVLNINLFLCFIVA
jgi:alpha-tubulin suppressor-like RCC1 family protein